MMLASSAAGVGFGNAGVHLCHGMSYAVASQVKEYKPAFGYEGVDHPLVPHGHSVLANAPAVFRFSGRASPERHLECARILAQARGFVLNRTPKKDAGAILADEISELIASLNVPVGLRALGYNENDIENLAEGTLPQHRVTKLCPRQPVEKEELLILFQDALDN